MGLFSNWIDKMSGASMKTDVNQFMTDYDTAYDPVNKNYEKMQGIAEGMMDPYSQNNLRQRSLITDMGADAAAESSRLGGRNAAMQGGAPAAALAMQTQDQANKVQAGGIKSFNEFLGGQYNQGLSAFSGVTSNMATMAGNRFNTQQNLTQTNKQIDANASKWGTNMIGGLLQGGAGALTGNPMMALGGLGNAFGGGQRGGYVQKYALGGGVKPSGGAQPDSIGAKFGRQSMDEIDDGWGRMPMNNEMFRPDNIMPESSPNNPRFYDKDPGPSGFQDMPSGFQDSPDFMQRKNDELKRQPPTDPRQGKFYEAMMEQNPEFQQRKENSLLNMQKAQQGMGGMMGGIMGQSGGYVGYEHGGAVHQNQGAGGKAMDWIHGTLDAAGMIPGFGIIPDAINTGIYGVEALAAGDAPTRKEKMTLMGMTGAAMIPLVGQGATAIKRARMLAKSSKKMKNIPLRKAPPKQAPKQLQDSNVQFLDKRTGVDKLTGKQVAKPTNINYNKPRANPKDYRAKRADYEELWDDELGKNVWQEVSPIQKRYVGQTPVTMKQGGGYIMKGGDIGGYEEKLENLDEDWEAKLNSNLYTSEGDYTREGLLDQYGFSNEAAVDTSYGGQSPNQAVGMNIREGDRNMRLDFDAHNRWAGDKDTADLRLRNRWAQQDPKAYSEFMQKSMGSQGDPDFDFMNEGNDFMDDENPKSVWDFQEGGEVKGGGILTQVMGPKGPMNLQTRIGGIKLG